MFAYLGVHHHMRKDGSMLSCYLHQIPTLPSEYCSRNVRFNRPGNVFIFFCPVWVSHEYPVLSCSPSASGFSVLLHTLVETSGLKSTTQWVCSAFLISVWNPKDDWQSQQIISFSNNQTSTPDTTTQHSQSLKSNFYPILILSVNLSWLSRPCLHT